jgi:hypothetical protein
MYSKTVAIQLVPQLRSAVTQIFYVTKLFIENLLSIGKIMFVTYIHTSHALFPY